MEAIREILSAPSKWTLAPRENIYSCDQVIDAYLKGKSEGIQQAQKLVMRQLDQNVGKTVEQTDRLVEHLASKGFHALTVYIKIDDWDTFTLMVTVPDEEWCDPQFLEVFNYVKEVEEHTESDFYRLEIHFCGIPDGPDAFNEQLAFYDGFVLKRNIR
jgi:hypothetical protein